MRIRITFFYRQGTGQSFGNVIFFGFSILSKKIWYEIFVIFNVDFYFPYFLQMHNFWFFGTKIWKCGWFLKFQGFYKNFAWLIEFFLIFFGFRSAPTFFWILRTGTRKHGFFPNFRFFTCFSKIQYLNDTTYSYFYNYYNYNGNLARYWGFCCYIASGSVSSITTLGQGFGIFFRKTAQCSRTRPCLYLPESIQ